jgi:hypothetical protein
MTRTEGLSASVIKILPLIVTRTESISARIIRMLPQLVGYLPVERACVKLDVFFSSSVRVCGIQNPVNLENSNSDYIEASTRASE